jgi:hypothetical protein
MGDEGQHQELMAMGFAPAIAAGSTRADGAQDNLCGFAFAHGRRATPTTSCHLDEIPSGFGPR